jgi:hypothetical protein
MNINQIIKMLTILMGSLSLIGFITKIFSIGLIGSLNLYLIYYQNIIYPIFQIPFDIFNITIPSIFYDLWILSFLCSIAYIKVNNIEKSRFYYNKYSKTGLPIYVKIIHFLVFGITGFSLFILLSIFNPAFYNRHHDITINALRNLQLVILATFLFFLINAFAPSL